TGSNMSGKTTFLRSMLINSLMAQTIYTCFAASFKTPVLKQYSSIRIQDDVVDGKSLYFQEVHTMHELLKASDEDAPGIFVLDEVFKGTNTVERIAASKAILTYLNKGNNIVLVATHDLELTQLLQSEYDLYHFTEVIENNVLTFDHRIKEGQLRTRNAIRVLELSHYPIKIVSEAQQLSELLSKTNYQPTP
ncbi:MAG TPA: DNA mismatch repair protein MutS, partial [Chryseosolibacter sp.]